MDLRKLEINVWDCIAAIVSIILLSSHFWWDQVQLNEVLLLAIILITYISFRREQQFRAHQKELHNIQKELAARALERSKKALLRAKLSVKNESSELRLTVFNYGAATARNVNISCPHATDLFSKEKIAAELPDRQLEPEDNVVFVTYMQFEASGSPFPLEVHLSWENEDGSPGDFRRKLTI